MIKTLTRHGNSYALIIDRAVLDLLHIEPDTELEVATDGKSLNITPVTDPDKRARVRAALKKTNEKFARGLKKLAE